jgi:hypothetical protein
LRQRRLSSNHDLWPDIEGQAKPFEVELNVIHDEDDGRKRFGPKSIQEGSHNAYVRLHLNASMTLISGEPSMARWSAARFLAFYYPTGFGKANHRRGAVVISPVNPVRDEPSQAKKRTHALSS